MAEDRTAKIKQRLKDRRTAKIKQRLEAARIEAEQGLRKSLAKAEENLAHAERWAEWNRELCEYYRTWLHTGTPPEKFPEWEG